MRYDVSLEPYKDLYDFAQEYMEEMRHKIGGMCCNDCWLKDSQENRALIEEYNLFNNPHRTPGQDLSIKPDSNNRLHIPNFCLWHLLEKKILKLLKESHG